MADQTDLIVYRGQAANLVVTRSAGAQNASAWTLTFTVRKAFGDTSPVFSKTGASITVDGTGSVITVATLAADNTLAPGTYYWDLWRTDPGSEDELAFGQYVVKRDVRVP